MRLGYFRCFLSDLILLPVVMFCLLNADLVTYALRMAQGQMQIVSGAREFKDVYEDTTVEDSVKSKLRMIERIREFAFDSIGLTRNENYTTYFDQKGLRLMYVVTASEPFRLKAKLWHFPVVGDVPYKGYFDEDKATAEKDKLSAEGYDTNIGGASGWSTLGWFKDPVLSSMLRMEEGELAELIIHELTHGTIFVKDNVDYNENLAQFVGEQGALWYLRATYPNDSSATNSYLTGNADADIKSAFMLAEAKFLDSAYRVLEVEKNARKKLTRKRELFGFIVQRAETLQLSSDTAFAGRLSSRLQKSGNTVLMQHVRYEGQQVGFEREFVLSQRNLFLFVKRMKIKYGE